MTEPLLTLDAVSKRFARSPNLGERIAAALGAGDGAQIVHAVDQVSLTIAPRETLALVGESGCGKSTLGRIAAGIHAPSAGEARLAGWKVMTDGRTPRKATTKVQMVFQDPFASLNPRMTIAEILAEGPLAHGLTTRADAAGYVAGWLARVGLDPAFATRYPHQFSGGQRQRVAIARALAGEPDLLIADEPVSALDVSVQAAIVNLLADLRAGSDLALVLISHDLALVRHMADQVAVMYLGRVVEYGPADLVFAPPFHPYTEALLAAAPRPDPDAAPPAVTLSGAMPSASAEIRGCPFASRCPRHLGAICDDVAPPERVLGALRIACHIDIAGAAPASV